MIPGGLCYIEGAWAYFTTRPLELQWGDDWNDAPYEHNAGNPYEWRDGRGDEPWTITRVAFYSDLAQPNEQHVNSPWSVQQINRREVAWLRDPRWGHRPEDDRWVAVVWAGATFPEFRAAVEAHGGTVYVDARLVR